MVTQNNGGKYRLGTFWQRPVRYLDVVGTGVNFRSDLVADPNNPADIAAAIDSDLELILKDISAYATLLGFSVTSTTGVTVIVGAGSVAFDDAAVRASIVANNANISSLDSYEAFDNVSQQVPL